MQWDDLPATPVRVNGIRLSVRDSGETDGAAAGKPALLLLHGWPQTSYAFRKLVDRLSAEYRLVIPDLRGLGASGLAPAGAAGGYDVRTLAQDIRALVAALGLERPYLVGHDWGGLIGRRYALDWPGELSRLAILDVAPHEQVLSNLTAEVAQATWHFYFNAFPELPERLVQHDVEGFLRALFRPKCHDPAVFIEECIGEYTRAYSDPESLAAGFAYYRAMFAQNRAIDQEHPGERITDPLLVLWGESGGMGNTVDVLGMWGREAESVTGRGIAAAGHYLPEEAPDEVVEEILRFGRTA